MVCFFRSWLSLLLGGHNFLISNPFWMIVSVSDAPRGGVQVLFGHQKQRSPPLGSSLPWALKYSVTGGVPYQDQVGVFKSWYPLNTGMLKWAKQGLLLTGFIRMVLTISLRVWAWQTVNLSEDPYKFGESWLAILVVCVNVDKIFTFCKKGVW
jgi:hypothetical protein